MTRSEFEKARARFLRAVGAAIATAANALQRWPREVAEHAAELAASEPGTPGRTEITAVPPRRGNGLVWSQVLADIERDEQARTVARSQ